jgi:hypothetical protein
MHEYDTTLKLLLQGPAKLAMRELTGVAIERWLNVELPEVRSTRVDLLGETADGLVHIELQSTNDSLMALRMAEYCLRVYRVFRKFPAQILLYVGEDPMTMAAGLSAPDLSFRYKTVDIRDLDGARLLESESVGDNIIAVLARLQDQREAVRRIVRKIATLEADARPNALKIFLLLSGLRRLGEVVEQEASKMPILNDILDHEVLGREYKKGLQQEALNLVRRLVEARFGATPTWAEERLAKRSPAELEDLAVRLLTAQSLEELLP